MKGVLRYFMMVCGAQCVMTVGTWTMHMLCASSLGTLQQWGRSTLLHLGKALDQLGWMKLTALVQRQT